MKVLRATDYNVMPWKNGGGTTTEIMIWPEGATVADGFDWRVSMADVVSDGPFSTFAGCNRSLMILSGAGLALELPEGERVELRPDEEPITFSGDKAIAARLLAGPVRDFNVIFRRHVARVWLRRQVVNTGSRGVLGAGFELVYAEGGPFRAGDLSVATGETLIIFAGESLEFEADEPVNVICAAVRLD